jgi:hypothetical protein
MSKTIKEPTETDRPDKTAERGLVGGAELLANWNYSLVDFYARRLQKYWQYPFALAEMHSVEDVAYSLIEFETELLADYADQADEFRRIAGGKRRKARGAPVQQYEASLLKAQEDAALIIEQAKAQAERIISSAQSRAEQMAGDKEATPAAVRKRA